MRPDIAKLSAELEAGQLRKSLALDFARAKLGTHLPPGRAEALFRARATTSGRKVFRSGWPDFVMKDRWTGELQFVEVKGPGDAIRKAQREMFAALESKGITVHIWNPRWPDTLTPWRLYGGKLKGNRPEPATLRRARDRQQKLQVVKYRKAMGQIATVRQPGAFPPESDF